MPAAFRINRQPAVTNPVYRSFTKRIIDIVLTVLAAPVVLPFILVMAALIALDGHSPFYSQLRVGRGGRTFRLWKLRTMVHDADARLDDHLSRHPAQKLEWDATQKLKNDPRVTSIGKILRKTSLDELPQLWNVLNGSMSLVGPRPMMVTQQADYHGHAYYRLSPGITGLWQISDRNEGPFSGRVQFDELYNRSVSFKTDVAILIRTVSVVLRGTGY